METYTELKRFVDNPLYHEQRQRSLARLDISSIDAPIIEIISRFAKLTYCFTLQSCYGHFLHIGQREPYHIEALPLTDRITTVEYRIAYIALCIENSPQGRDIFQDLGQIPEIIDLAYIQFGCAEWFWKRQINSYVLQVEPKRLMTKDSVHIDYREALYIEKIRNQFFAKLKMLLHER